MNSLLLIITLLSCYGYTINITYSQDEQNYYQITGRLLNQQTHQPITYAQIYNNITPQNSTTDSQGYFKLNINSSIPQDNQMVISIKHLNYQDKKFEVLFFRDETHQRNLGTIFLKPNTVSTRHQILLSTQDILNAEDNQDGSIADVLTASRDSFLQAAAYDFGASFYRLRGLENNNQELLINNCSFKSPYNHRINWGQWGGLNNMFRNRNYISSSGNNEHILGGLQGTTIIRSGANQNKKSTQFAIANSNKNYTTRAMITHYSGILKNNWSYSLSGSFRNASSGFKEGTPYKAWSIYGSLYKKINSQHQLTATMWYSPVERGKSTAITQEVLDLKGNRYNPNWGIDQAKIRNARTLKQQTPTLLLDHNWNIHKYLTLTQSIQLQRQNYSLSRLLSTGSSLQYFENQPLYVKQGSSRYTNPIHASWLPSYAFRKATSDSYDYEEYYLLKEDFMSNGQINWSLLRDANTSSIDRNSIYILYDDVREHQQFAYTLQANTDLSSNIKLTSRFAIQHYNSKHYAQVSDLLDGNAFLDIDSYGTDQGDFDAIQSNLITPNRYVIEGEKFQYHYELKTQNKKLYNQVDFHYKHWKAYLGVEIGGQSYQRKGLYQNGYFSQNSLGKSRLVKYNYGGAKVGLRYTFNGKTAISFSSQRQTQTLALNDVFVQERYQNETYDSWYLDNKRKLPVVQNFNLNYYWNNELLKIRSTLYHQTLSNFQQKNFYYSSSLQGGSEADFVQEVLYNMKQKQYGLEFGARINLTPDLEFFTAFGYGKALYSNNADLALVNDQGSSFLGKTNLKNYHTATGPRQVTQLGIKYNSPKYWWTSLSLSHFDHNYTAINALSRNPQFLTDRDGLTSQYNIETVQDLLKQEKLAPFWLVNLVGGKSWSFKHKYRIGFFAVINNLLDITYRSGGFQQGRYTHYNDQLEDISLNTPLYGNRYFFGTGRSYFINTYVRF